MIPLFAEYSIPDNFWVGATGSSIFGFLGLILLLIGYKLFDWMTPQLHFQDELKKGNMAVALVVATYLAAIAYMVSNVVH